MKKNTIFLIASIVVLALIVTGVLLFVPNYLSTASPVPIIPSPTPLPIKTFLVDVNTQAIPPHFSNGFMQIICGPKEITHNVWLPVRVYSQNPFTVSMWVDFRIRQGSNLAQMSYPADSLRLVGEEDSIPCEGIFAEFEYSWAAASQMSFSGTVTEEVRLRFSVAPTGTVLYVYDTGEIFDPTTQPFYVENGDGDLLEASDWVDWRQFEWQPVYNTYLPVIIRR